MVEDKDDINWLDNYKALKSIKRESPFAVPQEYFIQSADQIRSQVKLHEIASVDDKMEIPEGYFHELTNNIQSRIKLETLSPSETNHFNLPEHYFDTLGNKIAQKIQNDKAQSQPVIRRVLRSKTYQYAAAACLFLALGTLMFFNQNTTNNLRNNIQHQLASIADSDIENYLKLNTDISDSHLIMENINQDDIFKVKISDLSNDELSDYLTTLN